MTHDQCTGGAVNTQAYEIKNVCYLKYVTELAKKLGNK